MQRILQNSPHWQRFKGLNLAAIKWISRLMQSAALFHAITIASILAYVFIYANLPIVLLPGAGHDDGLFISHAQSIVSGHWLGQHSQFTLMKGPGYPLFLALMSLFTIPLPLAHSALYSLSAWLLSYATKKIFNSVLLSVTVLEVLLWHFGYHSMRVIRDEIYTPQILIVFSLLFLTVFVLKGSRQLIFAVLAGLVFGWFWTTREDGLIIVPAIVILFGCASHKAYRDRHSIAIPFKVFAGFISSYVVVLGVIGFINFEIYGAFVIVDIKGSFQKAFEALESVKPTAYVPHAAVPMDVREKVYNVSPTFSQLRPIMEGPGSPVEGWKKPSCDYYLNTCGDYANGWFMWALRDAVALHGNYSSARAAATFYENVHNEVASACSSGVISCYHNVLPFMPHVDNSQWRDGGASIKAALDVLSLKSLPSLSGFNSVGSEDPLRAASQFLGVRIYASPRPNDSLINYRVVDFAVNVGNSLIRIYSKVLPILLLLGICSTALLVVQCLYQKSYSIAFAIVCVAWTAVICRLATLVLVDISAFPAINNLYMGYAYPFSCYASLTSIFLVGRWVYYFRWDRKHSKVKRAGPAIMEMI